MPKQQNTYSTKLISHLVLFFTKPLYYYWLFVPSITAHVTNKSDINVDDKIFYNYCLTFLPHLLIQYLDSCRVYLKLFLVLPVNFNSLLMHICVKGESNNL